MRWTEKEKSEGHKTYKKLLELADGDSSDVIKKCLRIIKETRHIVEYELWNKIVLKYQCHLFEASQSYQSV